jgi:hypothetical protein
VLKSLGFAELHAGSHGKAPVSPDCLIVFLAFDDGRADGMPDGDFIIRGGMGIAPQTLAQSVGTGNV